MCVHLIYHTQHNYRDRKDIEMATYNNKIVVFNIFTQGNAWTGVWSTGTIGGTVDVFSPVRVLLSLSEMVWRAQDKVKLIWRGELQNSFWPFYMFLI